MTAPDDRARARYEADRDHTIRTSWWRGRTHACNAPLSNMYFGAAGQVAPCWMGLSKSGVDGIEAEIWSHERSVLDIWHGELFQGYRERLAHHRFDGPCATCAADIDRGGVPLAATFDRDLSPGPLPVALELELSNLCNFECLMCNGGLSSRIRRNRDHLPPMVSPYDDRFVDQIVELAPGLADLRFSGGEPMLHTIMYDIAERVIDVRPDLPLRISSNGSTLGPRAWNLLRRAEVELLISLESLDADIYESIRIGSDFGELMTNLDALLEHYASHPGRVVINTNPMRENWHGLPALVRWCTDRGIDLCYNTVVHPAEMSLQPLPAERLRPIVAALEAESFAEPDAAGTDRLAVERRRAWTNNRETYSGMVQQIAAWLSDAEQATTATAVSVGRRPER